MGSHRPSLTITTDNNLVPWSAIMEVERTDVSVGKIRAKDLPVVCVLGGPGSGKGSQCEILSYKRNMKHLSSGDLLRHEVLSGSLIGSQVYKLMEMGELVPTVSQYFQLHLQYLKFLFRPLS